MIKVIFEDGRCWSSNSPRRRIRTPRPRAACKPFCLKLPRSLRLHRRWTKKIGAKRPRNYETIRSDRLRFKAHVHWLFRPRQAAKRSVTRSCANWVGVLQRGA